MFPNKISHDQQIQVVIRFKQSQQLNHLGKCLYVSPHDSRQLIVQTPNKKQYFLFDSIATEASTQQQVYSLVGKPIMQQSTQGFNCCVFAYGQTGAGKTFSILGHAGDLSDDLYNAKRGILPRLLSDLFVWSKNQTARCSIAASYMEIYNQQIIDLLNTQIKIRQIREDAKKGVYVEGLSEQIITSYDQSIEVLLRGLKNRKIAATQMNAQSSRSHTIFTLNLQFQVREGENLKFKRSKINIVDLAGSERARLTKVQGERLKQGCNINRSLLVLGNVINALVESTKKKKYIPYRDSKLTYFLKDSLGGNSVTRLLANVDPNKKYLSQTLSTLMFAKRAKIIKMKVEMNENVTENFDCLRREIRQLRQELAQARYIKNNCSKITEKGSIQFDQESIFTLDRLMDTSSFDMAKNQNILQVFQENQKHYKTMLEIYEAHMENCQLAQKSKKNLSMHQQWKVLQRKNQALMKLSRNIPCFTKIFRENIILKNQLQKPNQNSFFKSKKNLSIKKLDTIVVRDQSLEVQSTCKTTKVPLQTFNKTVQAYQQLISQLEERMKQSLQKLQINYEQLLTQNKQKDQKIKQLLRKKQLPVNIEDLKNQNQLLKLNILELQSQLAHFQEEQNNKVKTQFQYHLGEEELLQIKQDIQTIKLQAEKQTKQIQEELIAKQQIIEQLKAQVKKLYQENQQIIKQMDHLTSSNKQLKRKMNQLLKISSQSQINVEATNTFWTSEEQSASEQFIINSEFLSDKRALEEKSKLIIMLEKQQEKLANNQHKLDQQTQKCFELSNQILKLHQDYGNEIINLKTELREYQVQRKSLKQDCEISRMRIRTIQEQCGKALPQIVEEYKDFKRSTELMLNSPKPKSNGLYSPPMTFRKTKQTNLGFRDFRNKNDNKKQQKSLKKNNPMKNSGILKTDAKLKKEEKTIATKKK